MKTLQKKSNYLFRIAIIVLILFCGWSYVLVRSAVTFGYKKGFQHGVERGALMHQLQDSIDVQNADVWKK